MDEAAAQGADLVVFPEISLQGYHRTSTGSTRSASRTPTPTPIVPGGPGVTTILEHAVELGIHVIFGLNELGDAGGVIYNTMVLGGPDGYIGKYRKVHVGITEQLTWRKGDDWPVFETAIGRIGMLICYDKMWPESCRELTLRGADILVMSTAWGYITGEHDAATNTWIELYRIYDRAACARRTAAGSSR